MVKVPTFPSKLIGVRLSRFAFVKNHNSLLTVHANISFFLFRISDLGTNLLSVLKL